MPTIKTSELTGIALNYAVAVCENTLAKKPTRCFDCKYHEERAGRDEAIYYCHHPKSRHDTDGGWGGAVSPSYGVHPQCPISELTPEPYSTDWSQGGPIIEREGISVDRQLWLNSETDWVADLSWLDEEQGEGFGPTPLIAAMRCFVSSKLGNEVEIPDQLNP